MTPKEIITGPEEFRVRFNVSRETLQRVSVYVDLLAHWQSRINLVGRSTLDAVWTRHIADSAQLLSHLPQLPCTVIDFGSGAGLPGLVLAILFADHGGGHVHLVESNGKKSAFLREAIRVTRAPATVHNRRIEDIDPDSLSPEPQVVMARALAPLTDLLDLAQKHMEKGAIGVFLKGQDVDDELTDAAKYWRISADRMPSRIHDQGSILIVREAARVHI